MQEPLVEDPARSRWRCSYVGEKRMPEGTICKLPALICAGNSSFQSTFPTTTENTTVLSLVKIKFKKNTFKWKLKCNRSFYGFLCHFRPCPHVFVYFWKRRIFSVLKKKYPSARSVFESFSPVHVHNGNRWHPQQAMCFMMYEIIVFENLCFRPSKRKR